MKAVLSVFVDWRVKLACLTVLVSAMYFWHVVELNTAVYQAEFTLNQKYNQELTALEDKAKESTKALKATMEQNNKERKIELQNANTKYSNLKRWLHDLPSKTSEGNLPGDSADSEARASEVIAELRRRHAGDLADYSLRAEEVRLSLVQCYKDYDSVKDTLDAFRDNQRSK